jgi:hypothetical protein
VLVYAPTMIKPGYKPPKRTIVPRRPALLLLMPDPVNAWTWIGDRANASVRQFRRFSRSRLTSFGILLNIEI